MKKIKQIIKDKILQRPIINLYNSNYDKKTLISYITSPFLRGVQKSHSNQIEALKIANIFHELGFQIDIYCYRYISKINIKEYNIIFGIEPLFENLILNKDNKNIIYIYYATGAYFCYQNNSELIRLNTLYKRKNIKLPPKRFVKEQPYNATIFSDAIITTGNDWTVSTYVNSKMPIYKVPVSVYNISWKNSIKKDFSKSKKNFLWFGSNGLVHKGLDLCLEVFKDLKDYNLYICSPKEDDFFKVYQKELKLYNIHYIGFVNIESKKFKNIIENCVFSIFPSCSEGQSGSVLTTMGLGLIPIVTKEVGIDILDNGFLVSNDIESIRRKILNVSKLENKSLEILSNKNKDFIEKNHTIDCFYKSMRYNLQKILGNKNENLI